MRDEVARRTHVSSIIKSSKFHTTETRLSAVSFVRRAKWNYPILEIVPERPRERPHLSINFEKMAQDADIFRQGVLDLSLRIPRLQILDLEFDPPPTPHPLLWKRSSISSRSEKKKRGHPRDRRSSVVLSFLYSAICILPLNLARFRLTFKF